MAEKGRSHVQELKTVEKTASKQTVVYLVAPIKYPIAKHLEDPRHWCFSPQQEIPMFDSLQEAMKYVRNPEFIEIVDSKWGNYRHKISGCEPHYLAIFKVVLANEIKSTIKEGRKILSDNVECQQVCSANCRVYDPLAAGAADFVKNPWFEKERDEVPYSKPVQPSRCIVS